MNRGDVQLLCQACGVQSPPVLEIEKPAHHPIQTVPLQFPFALIGRTDSNDVVLDDDQVSRRHVYIQVIAGRVFCIDFKSRTGTHWDDGSNVGWVGGEPALKIGGFRVRIQLGAPSTVYRWPDPDLLQNPLRSMADETDALPRFRLRFVKGVREESDWPMQRVLTLVGGSPQCKVQLVDPRVSRYHCSLLRTPVGTWVIDLFGRGGVKVNGDRVRFARLLHGDELQIGGVKTLVDCDAITEEKGRYLAQQAAHSIPAADPTASTSDEPADLGADNAQLPAALPGPFLPANLPASPARFNVMLPPQAATELKLNDSENLVNTLLYHFGQMQQQMAEQFNQAVMTMVQMFSTFHRDQMTLVRAELDRLHALNDEIVAIQRELSRRHAPRRQESTTGDSHVVRLTSKSPARPAKPSASPPALSQPEKAPGKPDPAPQPASTLPPDQPDPRPQPAAVASTAQPSLQPKSPPTASTPLASIPEGEDVHAWLCQRMELIREEQQSLWQKILTTVRSTVVK